MSPSQMFRVGERWIDPDPIEKMLKSLIPGGHWELDELQRTPERFARMLIELTTEAEYEFTVFDSTVDEIVIVKDIPFVALCAHHVVPFIGVCHVGYVPAGKIAGLSKFARLVQAQARGLWNQENLTASIGNDLNDRLSPHGVAVVMSAEHLCMTIRGVQTPGTRTTTSYMSGVFMDHDKQARAEFLQLLQAT